MSAYALPHGPVDRSRFFVPERITPLSRLDAYRALTQDKRRRYNQLFALYLNEMFVFFEDVLAETVLGALLCGPLPKEFADRLARFRWEEQQHTRMFRALNRAAAPELYAGRDYAFLALPGPARRLIDAAARRPRLFPLFFWVMLLQEDRSLYYSRAVHEERATLEPLFVQVHRVHLADEAGHVHADQELLERFWAPVPGAWRKVNARLLRWVVGEFFNAPKRAGIRVLEAWAAEFPDEDARLPFWRAALKEQEKDPGFHALLYSRESVPAAFAAFDRYPEMQVMGRALRAYEAAR